MPAKKPVKSPVTVSTLKIECDVDKKLFESFDRIESALVRIKHELLEIKRLAHDTGLDPKKVFISVTKS